MTKLLPIIEDIFKTTCFYKQGILYTELFGIMYFLQLFSWIITKDQILFHKIEFRYFLVDVVCKMTLVLLKFV